MWRKLPACVEMWRKLPACVEMLHKLPACRESSLQARSSHPQAGSVRHLACAGASMSLLLIAIAVFDYRITARADGGAEQFERSAGPFVVTVFTTPSPLRAGLVDISLLIQ